ncbi:MAG TPA: DUF2239 family protein [Steroidobacteraceae bacterium]|nr:DUF2239 family protein [Steroidobacteraceae bacterium]
MDAPGTYSAFDGSSRLFRGTFQEVVLKVKERLGRNENSSLLIFSDDTGKTMDFNFQGSVKDVLKRLEIYVSRQESAPSSGPGRPRLGVISREISLLPRHWEWLASQPGGASASLRKLIDEARRKSTGHVSIKQIQERAYRFMSVMAGDMKGYEEALRALYKADRRSFLLHTQEWPLDVRAHASEMAKPVFDAVP